jgi:hypothetical protein
VPHCRVVVYYEYSNQTALPVARAKTTVLVSPEDLVLIVVGATHSCSLAATSIQCPLL